MSEVTVEEQDSGPRAMPHWKREFPGTGAQLRQVRRWIKSVLPQGPCQDAVISIACEYANNAVLHSLSGRQGGYFVVGLAEHGSTLRIMVTDCGGPNEPRLIEPGSEYEEHGRGLHMVGQLSTRRGVTGDASGRTSWADVRLVSADTTHPQQPRADGTPPYHDATGLLHDDATEERIPAACQFPS